LVQNSFLKEGENAMPMKAMCKEEEVFFVRIKGGFKQEELVSCNLQSGINSEQKSKTQKIKAPRVKSLERDVKFGFHQD